VTCPALQTSNGLDLLAERSVAERNLIILDEELINVGHPGIGDFPDGDDTLLCKERVPRPSCILLFSHFTAQASLAFLPCVASSADIALSHD